MIRTPKLWLRRATRGAATIAALVVMFGIGVAGRTVFAGTAPRMSRVAGHPAGSTTASSPTASPMAPTAADTDAGAAGSASDSAFPAYAAVVKRAPLDVRAAPDGHAAVVFSAPSEIEAGVPETFLVKEQRTVAGREWVRVLLPIRPNGTSGWVPADAVELDGLPYRLEIDLSAFKADLFENDRLSRSFPIGVGTDNTPTPGGEYYIAELVEPPNPDTIYGKYVFELNGHSETIHGSFADGLLGIHGTNDPAHSIGKRVSHGCIRMRNEDISYLAGILPLGTPVVVRS